MLMRKLIATGLTAIVVSVAAINGVPSRVSALEQPNTPAALKGLTGITATPLNGETLYAAADGKLYRSTDAGLSWNPQTLPNDAQAGVVIADPALAQRLYVGDARRSEVYWYSPQSKAWLPVELAVANNAATTASGGIADLTADRTGHLYVATHNDGVYQMVVENNTLRTEAHSLVGYPTTAIAADGTGGAYALVNGQVFKSGAQLGDNWQPLADLPSRATSLAVGSGNPASLYVGTESSGLVRSTDNGQSWQVSNLGLAEQPGARLTVTALKTDSNNSRLVYAATAYWIGERAPVPTPGELAMSADGGATWTQLSALEQVATHLAPSPLGVGRVFTTATDGENSTVQAIALTPALATAPQAAARRSVNTQSSFERALGIDLTPTQWISWSVALLALAMLAVILFSKPQATRTIQASR